MKTEDTENNKTWQQAVENADMAGATPILIEENQKLRYALERMVSEFKVYAHSAGECQALHSAQSVLNSYH